ncbi:DUF2268 domain-containing putative Zn-dependent protease [Escherichia coli]|nr:DUF2268 domain-containing putative Zn-dependent protease [Escherichia coli]AKK41993.1 hypothetical protein NMECO18_01255 [Escherichia coli]MCD6650865.1 DUF2268 domain-containing protein [Escherichia coli]MCG3003771.1 DUF2268 domain-containing protein [Escherichia coli]MCI3508359.1 DUF2268 domain-containing protein [Escherichia coli]MCI3537380.1 DUF2268 domain-containing protein [Escherichia coli]
MNCIVLLDGPRYGSTLGEVIVSEGLAGHFSLELFAGEPDPREKLTSDIVQPYRLHLLENWYNTDYDCNAWFFGTGDLPRWLEYTKGFKLISRYLVHSHI